MPAHNGVDMDNGQRPHVGAFPDHGMRGDDRARVNQCRDRAGLSRQHLGHFETSSIVAHPQREHRIEGRVADGAQSAQNPDAIDLIPFPRLIVVEESGDVVSERSCGLSHHSTVSACSDNKQT